MRAGRTKPKAGFKLNVQKWPVLESGGASVAKKTCFDIKPDSHQGCRKSVGGVSTRSADSREKGSHGEGQHS